MLTPESTPTTQYAPDTEPIPGYRLIRLSGRGGFSEVWECQAPLGMVRAIKIVPVAKLGSPLERELAGLKCMRSIRHPHLLSVEHYEVADGKLFVVMPLAEQTLLGRFRDCSSKGECGVPRDELLPLIVQAAEALDYLHREHSMMHLDVKAGNLMLIGGRVRVGDFGKAEADDGAEGIPPYAYTPAYACPEVLRGQLDPTADQYSLAVTYQELLTGMRPYPGTEPHEILRAFEKFNPNLDRLSPADQDVLSKAYHPDPSERFVTCSLLAESLCAIVGVDSSAYITPPSELTAHQSGIFASPRRTSTTSSDLKSSTVSRRTTQSMPTATPRPVEQKPKDDGERIHKRMSGNLPKTVFATKLRAFIDSIGAQIVDADDFRTTLFIGSSSGWFGLGARRKKKGLHIEITSRLISEGAAQRVIDINITSSDAKLQGELLAERAHRIITSLMSFTMSTEHRR